MKIIDLEHTEKTNVLMEGSQKVTRQVPLSRDDGAPNFSFRVFTIEPGGNTPHHAHAQEHLNYIISGKGVICGEVGEERPVKQGDFVLILPNEIHQYKNASPAEPFVFICAVTKEYE
jgi:quercetin dioxygenase-like cupin family protein